MLMSMIADDAERTPSEVWQDGFINFKDLEAGQTIASSDVLVLLAAGQNRRDVIQHGLAEGYIMENPDGVGAVLSERLIELANHPYAPGARARREAAKAKK